MRTTDYNLPIFDDTDVADLNDYTEKLANALKGQIDRFGNPLTFKGIVAMIEDLPEDATAGDIYNVTDINKNYVFSGEEWLEYSDAIDNSCQDMISDEYDSTTTYAVGDYCIKDNTLYKCTTAITTAEAWNAAHWTAVQISTELQCKLDKTITVTDTGTSCNDYKDDGIYWFGTANTRPTDSPEASTYGWLQVMSDGGDNIRQIWHRSSAINGTNEFKTFVRKYSANAQTWSAWKKFAMGETVLYNNTSGSNGDITLSDSVTNYTYIEIFYKTNDNSYHSVKIYSPNNKGACLVGAYTNYTPSDGMRAFLKLRAVLISGTSITNVTANNTVSASETKITNNATTVGTSNSIYITRVVGYID